MKVFLSREGAKLPSKNYNTDRCYDISCVVTEEEQYHVNGEDKFIHLEPGQVRKFKTGVHIRFDKGYSASLRERSGLAGQGIQILGGEIDNEYTGEIIVVLRNSGPRPVDFRTGDRICQMRLEKDVHKDVEQVESLENLGQTERAEKAFGSSGK